jgi:hypothetical protein
MSFGSFSLVTYVLIVPAGTNRGLLISAGMHEATLF